ncbi:MAG: hypothetical protein RSB38_00240 [Oscillospiraceae bacterium]
MNVVLGISNKTIEKFIHNMREVNVLTSVSKKEQIIDTVLDRNPHALVLSSDLQGKAEWQEIISSVRKLKPSVKIVFLYGEKDNESKFFLNFLIEQGIYDFILGSIDEYNLTTAILETATLDDVRPYLLNKEELEVRKQQEQEKKTEENKQPSVHIPTQQKKLEVLLVEKIIEKETIQTQFLGNIKVAVGSLYSRSGCTHTTLEIGLYLHNQLKVDCCVVISPEDLEKVKSFYMLSNNEICGLPMYSDMVLALNHKVVIFDFGKLDEKNKALFFEQNLKILISPTAPWEIDTLTSFITNNPYTTQISYVFYPITDNYFKELKANLDKGNCIGYKIAYNPDFTHSCNDNEKVYASILKPITEALNGSHKSKKTTSIFSSFSSIFCKKP